MSAINAELMAAEGIAQAGNDSEALPQRFREGAVNPLGPDGTGKIVERTHAGLDQSCCRLHLP